LIDPREKVQLRVRDVPRIGKKCRMASSCRLLTDGPLQHFDHDAVRSPDPGARASFPSHKFASISCSTLMATPGP
jgi:hypothetical protein